MQVLAEIDDPLTGEVIDTENIDQLLERYEAIKEYTDKCYDVLRSIRLAVAAKTEGDSITRRVVGRLRKAKITMPNETFDQKILKTLWWEFPALSQEYLKIESIGVQAREFKKLQTTASDQQDFNSFRAALMAANQGRTGIPTITIEK